VNPEAPAEKGCQEERASASDHAARLEALLGSIDEVVFEFDADGTYLNIWTQDESLLVRPKAELLGRPIADFFDPDFSERLVTQIRRVLSTGEPDNFEYSVDLPTGPRWFLGRINPVPDLDATFSTVCFLARDITERQQTEAALARTNKLESLGTLAGGIAHDFNNILTGIMGNISLAMLYSEQTAPAWPYLADAEQASQLASKLTKQLLTFAAGGSPVTKVLALETLVRESADLMSLGSNVKCEFQFPADLWKVSADEGQISQVVHNLVLNAQQAMPGGGTIRIQADNVIIDASDPLPVAPGRYVQLSVRDHGTGIASDVLAHLFEPFFTTKAGGRGLGLATSFSIAKRHHGHLSVASQLGAGATFTVHLPASDATETPTTEPPPLLVRGRGRVLVMDDEPAVRRVAGRMLQELGYDAECAEHGAEALAMFEQARRSGTRFDFVVLDLTVPGGMGGEETARQLRAIDPRLTIVATSGYSSSPVMAHPEEHGFDAVLMKPYRLKEMSELIQRVVD